MTGNKKYKNILLLPISRWFFIFLHIRQILKRLQKIGVIKKGGF